VNGAVEVVTFPWSSGTFGLSNPRTPGRQTSIPPRLPEHLRHVDGLGQDDGADRVEEGEVVSTDEARDVGGE
jgi:hypothetical protein